MAPNPRSRPCANPECEAPRQPGESYCPEHFRAKRRDAKKRQRERKETTPKS